MLASFIFVGLCLIATVVVCCVKVGADADKHAETMRDARDEK